MWVLDLIPRETDSFRETVSFWFSLTHTQNTEQSDVTVLAYNSDVPSLASGSFEKKGRENAAGDNKVDETTLDKVVFILILT